MATSSLQDLEAAELAYDRVKAEIDALSLDDLAIINVDLMSATSVADGVFSRIFAYRDRLAALPEFKIHYVDTLLDYAKAAWYVHVTNLPVRESADAGKLTDEVAVLRSKLLMWAAPLVGAGLFDDTAIAKIKEGSGYKDTASDLVALVGLYRSRWDAVKSICGVTEQDLSRAAEIAPAMFALVSRREYQASASQSDGTLRVRRAWTLLDRAYTECRRGLAYLRYYEGDVDMLAPSLRKNTGPRSTPSDSVPTGPSAPSVPSSPSPTGEPPAPGSSPADITFHAVTPPVVGGGASPFAAEPERS